MKVIDQPHAFAALPRREIWPVSFNSRVYFTADTKAE